MVHPPSPRLPRLPGPRVESPSRLPGFVTRALRLIRSSDRAAPSGAARSVLDRTARPHLAASGGASCFVLRLNRLIRSMIGPIIERRRSRRLDSAARCADFTARVDCMRWGLCAALAISERRRPRASTTTWAFAVLVRHRVAGSCRAPAPHAAASPRDSAPGVTRHTARLSPLTPDGRCFSSTLLPRPEQARVREAT